MYGNTLPWSFHIWNNKNCENGEKSVRLHLPGNLVSACIRVCVCVCPLSLRGTFAFLSSSSLVFLSRILAILGRWGFLPTVLGLG